MQNKYNFKVTLICLFLLLIGFFANSVYSQEVPSEYKKFFAKYEDQRSILEKALNYIKVSKEDVGRSFALIAGISRYPNMSMMEQELRPAKEDVKKLKKYLDEYEFFDETVVLENENVTEKNLKYFLQTYFPERLKKFPKSRFLFAFSGHGMTEGSDGYLLLNTACNLSDKENSINLRVLKVYIDEVVKKGHHVLVLLNSCYSGVFHGREPYGGNREFIPIHPGAHAITAGGSGEIAWANAELGTGSVFFEKVIAGLDGLADDGDDGVITASELAFYLIREVRLSTNQEQNPQIGDISIHGSKGEFFFLNRKTQVTHGVLPEWKSERATAMGINAQKLLSRGKECFNSKDYKTAFLFFSQSAEAGDAEAMTYLGYMYLLGEGVRQDFQESVHWYRKAAEVGNVDGMVMLGIGYKFGKGVRQDYQEAVRLFRKAAEVGNSKGMVMLGSMYFSGEGVRQDYQEAVHWCRKAAEVGNVDGMVHLGRMYSSGKGVSQDYQEAVRWYRKAAEIGYSMGMTALGNMYNLGEGVRQDYQEAVHWYRKAAEEGDADGMVMLGMMYSSGKGVRQDYQEALRWYRKAAEKGDSMGMFFLGSMYLYGEGVSQDYQEALRWYHKAAEKGMAAAMNNLGYMYHNGKGVRQDYQEALRWYHKAAEKGEAGAMNNLGDMYYSGEGVRQDYQEAGHWYRKAAKAGDEKALRKLEKLGESHQPQEPSLNDLAERYL